MSTCNILVEPRFVQTRDRCQVSSALVKKAVRLLQDGSLLRARYHVTSLSHIAMFIAELDLSVEDAVLCVNSMHNYSHRESSLVCASFEWIPRCPQFVSRSRW